MASNNSQIMDKLLSVAYSEVEGSKPGERELAFIESVYDFLNRQSTYLSDKKVAGKVLKITNNAIDNASKKEQAIKKKPSKKDSKSNDSGKGKKKAASASTDDDGKAGKNKKKKKEFVYTKADKGVDKEAIAADKKKLKHKIATAKATPVKTDKYSASTKQESKKAKAKKAKQDKTGNYVNDAPVDDVKVAVDDDSNGETAEEMLQRVESMYQQFAFNYNKDYKTLMKILGKPPSKRVAPSYLIELCKVIRMYAPNVLVNDEATRPIRGCDRAFRISSNYEGKIYISDFEFAYELVADAKNDKIWNADMLSNHPICRHDASSVYVDHRSNVFFHELSSFKNEALMVFIPGKPAPKRTIQYKPAGDRCVYTDSYCHVKESELPKDYSVVFIKNGEKHLSLNKIPVGAGGPKLVRKEWTKFNEKVPDAQYLVMNKRHDAVFILTTDLENYCIRLHYVVLNKSVKKESTVHFLKQWEDFNFEELGYPASGWWPKAISMCYLRDPNYVVVAIQKHLFIVAENPSENYDYYVYHLGHASCVLYDIAEHPRKKRAIVAVDGVIKNCKLYEIDII
mmetsp:Transcript_66768/g.106132  ORF Transcript_66768/g.106132 Transcript_66768/m.106132 type:complete len:568 (-) Transcript_66768:173-1876(-)